MGEKNRSKKGHSIYHNYDAVLKAGLHLFEENALSFLSIENAEIVSVVSSETITIDVKKGIADMFFLLDNEAGLHIEWQAQITWKDVRRFQSYHANFMEKYNLKDVITIVLTTKKPHSERIVHSVGVYSPRIINLSERDAEKTLAKLREKISSGEQINRLELVYLPLYNSSRSASEVLKDTISLVKKSGEDTKISEQIVALMIVAAGRLLDSESENDIMEVLLMEFEDNTLLAAIHKRLEQRALERGEARGEARGMVRIYKEEMGLSTRSIAHKLGLDEDEINKIIESLKN